MARSARIGTTYLFEQLNRIEGKLDELARRLEELKAQDARVAERTASGGEVKPVTGL